MQNKSILKCGRTENTEMGNNKHTDREKYLLSVHSKYEVQCKTILSSSEFGRYQTALKKRSSISSLLKAMV